MDDPTPVQCGDFRIDLRARRLLRGDVIVPMRPKAWSLLLHLVENAGRVVTTDEVASAVWPAVVVGDDSIRKTVRELRAALGDDARTPKYLETVHGVGIRLIAEVSRPAPVAGSDSRPHVPTHLPGSGVVGRDRELELMHRAMARAIAGTCQVVFIAGEAGIGKSTLVRAFLDSVGSMPEAPLLLFAQSVGRGDGAEAYGPLLDGLETLRRSESRLDGLLRRHARQWYSQPPADEHSGSTAEVEAAPERMLREGIQLIEAIAAERVLVIVVEDAHAADFATTELIATLARRRSAARILVLVTFRRADALAADHPIAPLFAELELKRLAINVAISPFRIGDAMALLDARLGHTSGSESLADLLVTRSGGNPLFITALLDYLVGSGALVQSRGTWDLTVPLENIAELVPDRLRSLIGAVVAALPTATIRILEAGALAGLEFDARAVAYALDCEAVDVEETCNALVAQERLLGFLGHSRWEDGTQSGRYGFVHQLYQAALQTRVASSRRQHLHRRIAERLEAGAATHAARISAELALHFARGGDDRKAVAYFLKAAERANRRGAHLDAISSLRQALAILDAPDIDERQGFRLLRVLLALAGSVSMVSGFANPEFEALMTRARTLSEQLGALPATFLAQFGLQASLLMQCRIEEARKAASRLLELGDSSGLPLLRSAARGMTGWTLFYAGDFAQARESFERALEIGLEAATLDSVGALGSIPDLRTYQMMGLALSCAVLGDVDAAVSGASDAIKHSAAHRPGDRVVASALSALLHTILGNDAEAAAHAAETHRLIEVDGEGVQWRLLAVVIAALVAVPMDVVALEEGFAAAAKTGYRLTVSELRALAASRMLTRGDFGGAQTMMDACDRDSEPCWAAEVLRMHAELLMCTGNGDRTKAEAMLHESLQLARDQKAGLWEQRAAGVIGSLLEELAR